VNFFQCSLYPGLTFNSMQIFGFLVNKFTKHIQDQVSCRIVLLMILFGGWVLELELQDALQTKDFN